MCANKLRCGAGFRCGASQVFASRFSDRTDRMLSRTRVRSTTLANTQSNESASRPDAKPSPIRSVDPTTWVDRHGDVLYRFALARVRDPALSEDLVQETFVSALRSQSSFEGRSNEQTWLISILRNKIIDYFRSKASSPQSAELESDDEFAGRFFDKSGHRRDRLSRWPSDGAGAMEKREFWLVLDECVSKLPAALIASFTLRELEKLDTKGICKLLGITASNLWMQLHRARLLLRTCLERNWFSHPRRQED